MSENSFFSGFKCSDDKFTCNNGECVKKNLLCDGDFACKDGSDEDNCECPISMFNCKGGGCLLATSVCDGTNDCSNGDDEKNCRKLLFVFILTIVNRETWQEKKETKMTLFKADTHDATNRCDTSRRQVASSALLLRQGCLRLVCRCDLSLESL